LAFLQLRVESEHPGFVDETLMAAGALSVSYLDGEDHPVLEPLPGETPLWPNTVVLGLFPDGHDAAPTLALLRALVPDGDRLRVSSGLVEDQDWVRAWLEHWQPLRFGQRLWVTPAEKRQQIDAAAAVVMTLDPGLAFGTGTHPTTALCLEWLEGQPLQGCTVLDYGCGSGILAIAALLLGARHAVCVDIDPQALLATRQNAATNGVADRIETCLPQDFQPTQYDRVLANILSGPLVQLAPRLGTCLADHGRLVLAGLLERQAAEVRTAYAAFLDFEPDGEREGWTRIAGRRR